MSLLFVTLDHPPLVGGMSTYSSELAFHLFKQETCIVLASRIRGWREVDARQSFKTYRVPNILGVRELSFVASIVYFILKHRIRVIIATQWFPCGLATYIATRLMRRPYYVLAHGSDFLDDTATFRRRLKSYLKSLKMVTFRGAKRVIANSRYTKKRLISLGIPDEKIVVVNIGVDAERFRPGIDTGTIRQSFALEGLRVILTVCRLDDRKGVDTVIQALPKVLERCRDVLYLIVGKGPERDALEKLVGRLGLTRNVRFAGFVSDDDLPAVYNACDLFIMLSRTPADQESVEGFGIVFIEAAACGKPSIGGLSGGIPDAVLDEKTGLLVNPTDVDAAADAIIRLLENPEEAERLGRQGRERVLSELQWPTVTGTIHALTIDDKEKNSRRSVAHIITRLDRGGSTDNTLLTVLGLSPSTYRVTLVSGLTTEPSPLLRRLMERTDVELLFVPTLLRALRPLKDMRAIFDLWLLFRRKRFDLVHTHSSKAGILGRWAAYLAGCKHLVHTPHGHVFEGYYGPALSRLFVAAERLTAKITDTIVTLTPKGIDDHLAWRIAPREKFTVIPSGVELEGFQPGGTPMSRASLGLPPGAGTVVGSAGRLEPVKGFDLLVEASALVLKKMPDVWFVVAGDGEEREALKEQALRLGVSERWRFLGWRESLGEVYNAFDLSVLPSRMEGMGRTAVEAMACGLPVVATGVGGLPWVVEDGVTGIIVPPEEPRALADAIVRLLDDEGARKEMGAAGARRAQQLFSLQVMVEGLERLYGRLLDDRKGTRP